MGAGRTLLRRNVTRTAAARMKPGTRGKSLRTAHVPSRHMPVWTALHVTKGPRSRRLPMSEVLRLEEQRALEARLQAITG